MKIDKQLVSELIQEQFPEWADLSINLVIPGGWDNRTFRLGDDKLVRLPSGDAYAGKVEKEQRWLPILARSLLVDTPRPLAMGEPSCGYPWRWSVYPSSRKTSSLRWRI